MTVANLILPLRIWCREKSAFGCENVLLERQKEHPLVSDSAAAVAPLSFAQNTALLTASSNVTELLALDEAWTVYLTSVQEGRIEEIDYRGLLDLSERMLAGLDELAQATPTIRDILDPQPDLIFDVGFRRIVESLQGYELFGWLLSLPSGELARLTRSAWQWIGEEVGEERSILEYKRNLLANGERCDPDFRLRFKCVLALAGVGMAGAVAGIGVVATLGVAGAIGIGVGAAAIGTGKVILENACGDGPIKEALA